MDANLVRNFRELFKWLEQTHRPILTDKLTAFHRGLFDETAALFPPADEKAVESLLPSVNRATCDFANASRFLYLAPNPVRDIALGFLPFIAVQCDLSSTNIRAQIYVGMVLRNREGVLRVLGFRYESPEGSGEGLHDFYHVQLITSLRAGGRSLNLPEADLDWLPTAQPSIPVDAVCPVTLSLALLVSLYGINYLDEVARSGAVGNEYFAKMQCWRQRPRYWRAQVQGGEYFVRTRTDDQSRLRMVLCGRLNVTSVALEQSQANKYRDADRKIDMSNI